MDWIDLVLGRENLPAVMNTVMNFILPLSAGNLLTGWGNVSFSRMPVWWSSVVRLVGRSVRRLVG